MVKDYEKKLNKLKEELDKAKNLRIRAEARLEQLNIQNEEITKEIEMLGVKPEELDSEINRLKIEIDGLFLEVDEMIVN